MPRVGRVVRAGCTVCGDCRLQRAMRRGGGLVTRVEKDLLVGAPEQARGLDALGVSRGEPARQQAQHIDRDGRMAGVDQVLSVEAPVLRVVRILPAHGFRELAHAFVLADVAQFLDEPFRLGEILAAPAGKLFQRPARTFPQAVEIGRGRHPSQRPSIRSRVAPNTGCRMYLVGECRHGPSLCTGMSSTAAPAGLP